MGCFPTQIRHFEPLSEYGSDYGCDNRSLSCAKDEKPYGLARRVSVSRSDKGGQAAHCCHVFTHNPQLPKPSPRRPFHPASSSQARLPPSLSFENPLAFESSSAHVPCVLLHSNGRHGLLISPAHPAPRLRGVVGLRHDGGSAHPGAKSGGQAAAKKTVKACSSIPHLSGRPMTETQAALARPPPCSIRRLPPIQVSWRQPSAQRVRRLPHG